MTDNSRADELSLIDEQGATHTLRVVLLALMASALAISAVTFLLKWSLVPQLALVGASSCLLSLILLHFGRVRLAVLLALLGIIYALMHAAARHDGVQSVGLVLVPVLIVVAGLLLDRLKHVLVTGGAILATCGMLAIRYFVLRAERYSTNDMGDLFIFALFCAIAALLGQMLARRIREGFRQIRESESRYRDISEELRRRAEELQKIMDVAPVALFVANDPKCSQVTVNRMGNALFELPPGANSSSQPAGPTLPRPFFRNGIEVPVCELPLQTAARGEEVRDSELELVLSSGKKRLLWGHATPLRDAVGRVRGAIAVAQDVTEARQRADAMLRESEERFRDAANAAPVIMWFGDNEKRLTFVNEEMRRFTGLPAKQLLGNGWMQVIHPDDLERVRAVYSEGVDRRRSYQLEYRARRMDGEYRHMLGTTSPRFAGDKYLGHVGSVVDVTDLKRRQEEDLARQKLESVGTLASGIAHDFNNLLGGVLAQADLALADSGTYPKEELTGIREVAIRGSEIVRQLMIYAGKESAAVELIDVSRIVKEMIELLKVSLSKHATLETGLGQDLPAVRANAAQLRQIVMNLVTNASDAIGDRDGVIRITTRCGDPESSRWASKRSPEGDYLQLEVSDTGCGMSQEMQAKVFDPFFTTKSAGHGLGLAVVQGIVRGLGGVMHVASEPGKGTTFKVLLPCAAETAEPSRDSVSATSGEASPCQNVTVLVVEDESPLRQSVVKMLRKTGFEVIEAADGSVALDILRANGDKIDVMLLDMTIPGAASDEVITEAVTARPGIRVILTSAYSQEMVIPARRAPQIRSFIRKPYQLADLVRTLRIFASS
jgi:PAS domain S-box-containing protein